MDLKNYEPKRYLGLTKVDAKNRLFKLRYMLEHKDSGEYSEHALSSAPEEIEFLEKFEDYPELLLLACQVYHGEASHYEAEMLRQIEETTDTREKLRLITNYQELGHIQTAEESNKARIEELEAKEADRTINVGEIVELRDRRREAEKAA